MNLLNELVASIVSGAGHPAFFIHGQYYSYANLEEKLSSIKNAIQLNTVESEKNIGIVTNDDLETYAAIIAIWLEGKAYVPLNPANPKERNESVIEQACIKTIIDSSAETTFPDYKIIESKKLTKASANLLPKQTNDDSLAYILFTSGTTGKPKGVPITMANLQGFVNAYKQLWPDINKQDRCLQMFDLTFDLSVMSYLIPLLHGACVYTIPKEKIKYLHIYELMETHKLTIALMVPSMLHYLRPYFNEIHSEEMKYSLFCGEALPLDVTEEWSKCVPNAEIFNVYGPTEDTIFCTHYRFIKGSNNKSHNGILSIGKAMPGTRTIIIDENENLLVAGQPGQLCLSGKQLTPGYWMNEEKNKEAFFTMQNNGASERFYKTGDLCMMDEAGDIYYSGRIDFQTKIQGLRVELTEIEFHAKSFLNKINVAALALADGIGNTEIGLAIESKKFDTASLMVYLKSKMPVYMIPKKILFEEVFPLNSNEKIDRVKLTQLFK